MKRRNSALVSVFLLLAVSGWLRSDDTVIPTEPQQPWITIFVHGIISVQHQITFQNLIILLRDDIVGSMYARTVELIRTDPYFYQYHSMQEMGLRKISMLPHVPGAASSALAYAYEANERFAKGFDGDMIFYTFGWSGLISPRMRYIEAEIFFDQLQKELATYHADNIIPKVRIVAYSNGGNLALELGRVALQLCYTQPLIDELILLGVPVVRSTDYFVASPIFTKVWHLYSKADKVQTLDTFSSETFFSQRTFNDRETFIVPDKVTQVEIQVKRPATHLFDVVFGECRKDVAQTLQFRYNTLRKASPNHSELWSFGWKYSKHGKHSPFRPLPTAAFVPWITHAVATGLPPKTDHAIADILTHKEVIIVQDPYTKACNVVPFLTLEQLAEVKALASQFEPTDYSEACHKQKIYEHLATAHEEHRLKHKQRLCV